MKTNRFLGFSILVGMAVAMLTKSEAVTISSSVGATNAFTVSSTDLINTGQVSFGSSSFSGTAMWGSSPDKLNDGSIFFTNRTDTTYEALVPSSGSVYTVTLDTSSGDRTNGYNITSLVSLTAYAGGGSAPRLGQYYTLEFSYIGNAGFSVITNVAVAAPGQDDRAVQVVLTDFGAAGYAVDQIRFSFNYDPAGNTKNPVYREIDVFGYAIPEPSGLTLALMGLALGVAFRFRVRR